MKAILVYAVVAGLLIALLFGVLSLVFPGDEARTALLVSGVVAWVVQSVTYATVRLASPANLMVGWGLGTILRFLVVIGFGVVVFLTKQLDAAPALLSLVTYFFICTLVEPFFLKS